MSSTTQPSSDSTTHEADTARLPALPVQPAPPAAPARSAPATPRPPIEAVLGGLTAAEVAERQARGEVNRVPFETSRSYGRIVFENTVSFINILLFGICIFLAVLGLYGDAGMTAALVTVNVVVGVFQEVRAKRKLDRIALLTRPTATVIRDGRERVIDPNEVVLDDLLVVQPGDQVLVDGKVVVDSSLSVDESLLTGESDPIRKRPGDPVYSGSFCVTGSGIFRAEQVGAGSMAQQITGQARAHRDVRTPLQREIGLVIRVLFVLMLLLGAQVADTFRHLYEDVPLTESVRAAAVIVALVPQGLIFMVTVTYAMAAARMSGKGALIQRMNAVESTSQIDVLCMDKTGTLTSNRLQLDGLHPLGVEEEELRRALGQYAASTSAGNRTNEALQAGLGGTARPLRREVPFSSARKWSAQSCDGDGQGTYILGAPEMVRPGLVGADGIDDRIAPLTERGLRVLLFARHQDPAVFDDAADEPALPGGLEPLGLVSISDELRPEARETIEGFRQAGIALKVISGDNPETVAALARQAGIDPEARAISGLELKGLDEAGLRRVASETTVFGRITPEQKESLVRALRAEGHYVAMTGDGVNDVLALKQAHLAIAMRSGSQVTRAVADIVLLEDSFAPLPAAFKEGQRILKGMQDIIRLFLVRTLYVSLIIFGAAWLGQEFPTTPKQNSLLALLTVGLPVLFLAAWARPGPTPRRLVPSASHFVLPAAVTIAFTGITVYQFFLTMSGDVETARTAMTVATVLCGLTLIPFSEPPTPAWTGGEELSGDWRPTILAGSMGLLFVAALFIPPARDFYELERLPFSALLIITLVVAGWASGLRYIWRLRVVDRLAARLEPVRDWGRRLRRRLRPGMGDA